jgi:uncharacterized protein (DUF1778 family)
MALSKLSNTKNERLEARMSSEQKRLFKHAADLSGQSLTDFVITALQDAASKVIHQHKIIQLSLEDQLAFANSFLNPGKPNEKLLEALKMHNEKIKEEP